jgi:hypothetical protein
MFAAMPSTAIRFRAFGLHAAQGCPRRSNPLQIKNNVLSHSTHTRNPLGLECGGNLRSRGFQRLAFGAQPNGFNHVSGDTSGKAASNGLDFGQLGHGKNSLQAGAVCRQADN